MLMQAYQFVHIYSLHAHGHRPTYFVYRLVFTLLSYMSSLASETLSQICLCSKYAEQALADALIKGHIHALPRITASLNPWIYYGYGFSPRQISISTIMKKK